MKSTIIRKAALCVALASSACISVFAQKDLNSTMSTIKTTAKSAAPSLIDIVSIGLVIGGVLLVIPCIIKFIREDRDSAYNFLRFIGGVICGALILQVFKLLVS